MAKIPNQTGKARAKAAEVIEASHDLINEALPDLTQSLIDSALGLRFRDEKGNVYTKEPNIEALKRCLEIVMGKPVAKVETGEIGAVQEYEEWIKAQPQVGAPKAQDSLTQGPLPALPQPPFRPLTVDDIVNPPLREAADRMTETLRDLGIE